jgi:predicted TIM-barrel fold metal-dependent hydrolase
VAFVYDAHVHIFPVGRGPNAAGGAPVDATAEGLLRELDAAGVAAALIVQSVRLGEETGFVAEALRRYPQRLAGLGLVADPFAPDAPERMQAQRDRDGLRGLRLYLNQPEMDEGVRAGQVDPLLRRARDLGLPIELLNRVPAHPTILRIARAFPDVPFVVDHLGHPSPEEEPGFASSGTLFEAASCPNVYVKLSNHVAAARSPFPWTTLHDYQRRLIDAFGPRRLMWGSNWPMTLPSPTYGERLDALRQVPAVAALSPNDRAWIFGGTVRSLWPLGPANA